jgi:putative peptide zinc metalloprotease protein
VDGRGVVCRARGKFLHWLAASPQLAENRPRAILTSLGLAALTLVAVGVVPMPDHQRVSGIVQSAAARGSISARTDSWARPMSGPGTTSRRRSIVTCTSPELTYHLSLVEAQLREYQVAERQYLATSPVGAQIAHEHVQGHEKLVAEIRRRLDSLVVRAPHDGVVVPGVRGISPEAAIGAFVHRGDELCEIVDTEHVRVAAALSSVEAEPLQRLSPEQRSVEIRPYTDPDRVVRGERMRVIPAGQKVLPHAALGYSGGGTIETDPQDRTGLATKSAQFFVYVEAPGLGAPGERVKLRFTYPRRPLLGQWWERFLA